MHMRVNLIWRVVGTILFLFTKGSQKVVGKYCACTQPVICQQALMVYGWNVATLNVKTDFLLFVHLF